MAYTNLGTYTGTCYNVLGGVITGFTYKATVQYEQDIVANLTRLKITSTVACTGSTGTASTFYFKLNNADYEHKYINLGYGVSYTTSETYTTIYHNTDGTKSFTLSLAVETEVSQGSNANLNNYTLKRGVINQSITLPTIPRASDFTVPNFTCGSAGTITIKPVVSSFTHKVYYSFGSASGTVSSSATTSVSWTPSNDLAKQIPNSTSGIGSITVDTYNGSTKVGSKSHTFTLYVNSSMFPTYTSLTLTGVNLLGGLYVQGKSSVKATITSPAGSYGSTITGYQISGHALESTSASATSGVFTGSGNATYKGVITDSRGRKTTKSASIYIYPYNAPNVNIVTLTRANSAGTADEQGEYIKLVISYNIVAVNNKNLKYITVDYRVKGATSWTNTVAQTTLTDYINTNYNVSMTLKTSIASQYEFRIGIKDNYTTTYAYGNINTATCLMDIEENGVGISKYWEKGALDVGGDTYIKGTLSVGDTTKITSSKVEIKGTDTSGNEATCQLDAWNNSSFRIRTGGSGVLATKFAIQASGDTNMAVFTPTSFTVGAVDSNEKTIILNTKNTSMTGRAGMYSNTNNFGLYDWQNSRSILQYNHSSGLVNLMGRPAMTMTSANGYYGFNVNGNTNDWIRTSVAGLIPYASGGNSSSLGTTSWAWKEIHGKTHYVHNILAFIGGFGTNYLIAGGTGDSINYGTNNMRTRCHWGWGISDNNDSTNAVIDSRLGRFIGKSAYWHNSSKSLKSDVRVITSEKEPMALSLYEYDTIDQNVTLEMIEDFLDSINIKTYISDYKQEGVTQEEHDDSKAHVTQLGYIADEFADHPLFKYVGEMIGEYHAINTTALISAVIAGYQSEKRKRMHLEARLEKIENLLESKGE